MNRPLAQQADETAVEVRRKRLQRRLGARRRADRLFRAAGFVAVLVGLSFIAVLFSSVISQGMSAFAQTRIQLDFEVAAADAADNPDAAVVAVLASLVGEASPDRATRRELADLLSIDAASELQRVASSGQIPEDGRLTAWLLADDDVDMFVKGRIDLSLDEAFRRLSDRQVAWLERLDQDGRLDLRFNSMFFSSGDSREPELAGIRGAVVGSLLMLSITILLAFPTGVAAAIYLEEFAPRNRWSDLVEVNINNLAAVPSIVFGLLGLAVFIDWFGMPRSAPLVGGLVLVVLALPVVIISARSAIKSVPASIREAAYSVGASRMQVLVHHVLPLAMPGILTGTIISMSRALGETAPLLMIGMVAFIVDVPTGYTDPATALPVQIYLWADSPEPAFAEKTAGAIIVLLAFLIMMNLAAIALRKRLENKYP